MIPLTVEDTQLHQRQLGRWQHNETIVILLEDQARSCYTMRLFKNGKLIGHASSDKNDLGILLAMALDPVPIDPAYLRLN